jgi:hypothetical protein
MGYARTADKYRQSADPQSGASPIDFRKSHSAGRARRFLYHNATPGGVRLKQ